MLKYFCSMFSNCSSLFGVLESRILCFIFFVHIWCIYDAFWRLFADSLPGDVCVKYSSERGVYPMYMCLIRQHKTSVIALTTCVCFLFFPSVFIQSIAHP